LNFFREAQFSRENGDPARPMAAVELHTVRLKLRSWRDEDRAPFAALNADLTVMEHFPAVLTRTASDALVDAIVAGFNQRGWGLWAVEVVSGGEFAGFVGLNPVTFPAPFTPAVEIGWRLGPSHWDRGFATEAARAVLNYGFEEVGLREIVSFTATSNRRSQRVMQKLGMTHDPDDDFDHPGVDPLSPLRRHVLYRASPPPQSSPLARAGLDQGLKIR
jgi:RimJ/RimL family protein N-acetyltransferase